LIRLLISLAAAALGQAAHLAGHDREAAALFAGTRRLEGGIERQDVGLHAIPSMTPMTPMTPMMSAMRLLLSLMPFNQDQPTLLFTLTNGSESGDESHFAERLRP